MNTVLKKVRRTIEKHRMLRRGDRVIAAVSGGPDSMALLQVLFALSEEYGITLNMAHLNHNIRGEEAIRDEQFVRKASEHFHLFLECGSSDIPALRQSWRTSLEDAARRARYRFLNDVAVKYGAQRIAVGHHRGDQVETVMINFLRGSGSSGLKGIPPVRDGLIIRPLIDCTREEIMAFLTEEGVPFIQDRSNDDIQYLRNRIRERLIPELRKNYNPNLEESITRTAEILHDEDDYLESVTASIMKDWSLDTAKGEARIIILDLFRLHEALQRRAIRAVLKMFSPPGRGVDFTHIEAIRDLACSGDPHGSLNLPYRIVVMRRYDNLVIQGTAEAGRKDSSNTCTERFCYEVTIPGMVKLPEAGMAIRFSFVTEMLDYLGSQRSERVAYMDFAKLVPPLALRSMQPGDRMQPLGMAGTQKVKDYFIDRKIPLLERGRIPLLVDGWSVVWIAGMRLSERVKVTKETGMIVRAEII